MHLPLFTQSFRCGELTLLTSMLLNASHEITFSGLPPDLLDAYVRYKKGTRALVAWFIQYSPTPTRRAKSLPIKELEHLAQSVRKSLRSLPDVVHFHFRETIAARKRLSKYYRDQFDGFNDDEDTINHEHFTTRYLPRRLVQTIRRLTLTSSLASIYADLCACCGGPGTRCPQSRQRASATCPSDSPINHYHGLTVEEAEELEDNAEAVPSSCPECEPQARSSSDTEDLQVHFVDDDLGNLIEVAAAVQVSLSPLELKYLLRAPANSRDSFCSRGYLDCRRKRESFVPQRVLYNQRCLCITPADRDRVAST